MASSDQQGVLLSATEAAQVLHVSVMTINRRIAEGRLPAHGVGPRQNPPSQYEIRVEALQELAQAMGYTFDLERLSRIETSRRQGSPEEALRRIAVTEERMAAMETRITELEQERGDLAAENISLKGRVTTLEAQIDGILARPDEPIAPPVRHLYENTGSNAPVARHDAILTVPSFEPLPIPAASFKPTVTNAAHTAGPLYSGIISEAPVPRSYAPRRDMRPSRDPAKRRTTDTPDMPDNLFGFARLVEAHGISATTAKDQWIEQQLFQVTGPYKIGRNPKAWAIDETNATEAIRLWIHFGRTGAMQKVNMKSFGNCGVSTASGILCPCYRIVAENG